ncbi:MAG: DUF2147 domain-containing protein [Pseudomonadota bacterium]
MKKTLICALAAFTLSSTGAFAADPTGVWTNTDGESKIKVSNCGSSLCGQIVWLKKPRKDTENVDESKRSRDLVGVQIFNDLKKNGDNQWVGSSYSPRKGKIYSGAATLKGDRLTLKGCLTSARLLCQTVKFNRGG